MFQDSQGRQKYWTDICKCTGRVFICKKPLFISTERLLSFPIIIKHTIGERISHSADINLPNDPQWFVGSSCASPPFYHTLRVSMPGHRVWLWSLVWHPSLKLGVKMDHVNIILPLVCSQYSHECASDHSVIWNPLVINILLCLQHSKSCCELLQGQRYQFLPSCFFSRNQLHERPHTRGQEFLLLQPDVFLLHKPQRTEVQTRLLWRSSRKLLCLLSQFERHAPYMLTGEKLLFIGDCTQEGVWPRMCNNLSASGM